jgi:hypothetical protein
MQIGRLFGNEIGTAFVQTFARVREQVYSNLSSRSLAASRAGFRLDLGISEVVKLMAGLGPARPRNPGARPSSPSSSL